MQQQQMIQNMHQKFMSDHALNNQPAGGSGPPMPPQHAHSTPQMPNLMPLPAAPDNNHNQQQLPDPKSPVIQDYGQSPGGSPGGNVVMRYTAIAYIHFI